MFNFARMRNALFFILILITPLLFSQDGTSTVNQTDKEGRKQGEWIKYHEGDSAIRYKGGFVDDKPIGTFTHFYSNGEVRIKLIHSDNDISRIVNYWPGGAVMGKGKYIKEDKEST